jgi:hypothetical protein
MISAPDEIIRPQEAGPIAKNLRVLGIDLAPLIFHVVCLADTGNVVWRKRLPRGGRARHRPAAQPVRAAPWRPTTPAPAAYSPSSFGRAGIDERLPT